MVFDADGCAVGRGRRPFAVVQNGACGRDGPLTLEYGTRPRFEDSTGTDGLEPWLPCCCLKKIKTEVGPRSFWNSFHEKVAFNYHTASKKQQQKSDELVLDKRPLASQPR